MGFPMTVDRVISRNAITNANAKDDIRRLAEDSVTLYRAELRLKVEELWSAGWITPKGGEPSPDNEVISRAAILALLSESAS